MRHSFKLVSGSSAVQVVDDGVTFVGVFRILVSCWLIQIETDFRLIRFGKERQALEFRIDLSVRRRLVLPMELQQMLVVVAGVGQFELDAREDDVRSSQDHER